MEKDGQDFRLKYLQNGIEQINKYPILASILDNFKDFNLQYYDENPFLNLASKARYDFIQRRSNNEALSTLQNIEQMMNANFGDRENPLLVSVRSGARVSMPGMMDTVLNLGLNEDAVLGLAKKSGNNRFAWDSYRRFVQMYGDVVLGLKPESKEDIDPFEEIIEDVKKQRNVENDTDLTAEDLKSLVKIEFLDYGSAPSP